MNFIKLCVEAHELLEEGLKKGNEQIKKEFERMMKMTEIMNKKVIVRGDRSGVFFGTITHKEGHEVTLKDCRRLWYWSGAASISQIATDGVKRPSDCKFTVTVEKIVILDAIEIIPCTEKAIENIEGVKKWMI